MLKTKPTYSVELYVNSFAAGTCSEGGDEFSNSKRLRYLLESKPIDLAIVDINTELQRASLPLGAAAAAPSTNLRELFCTQHSLIRQNAAKKVVVLP
jgi:hypothetical protein